MTYAYIYVLMLELVLCLIKGLAVKTVAYAVLIQIVNLSARLVPCVTCPRPSSSSIIEVYPMT